MLSQAIKIVHFVNKTCGQCDVIVLCYIVSDLMGMGILHTDCVSLFSKSKREKNEDFLWTIKKVEIKCVGITDPPK